MDIQFEEDNIDDSFYNVKEDGKSETAESDDSKNRKVFIKELDLNDLYPRHKEDFKNGSKYVIIGKPGCLKMGTNVVMWDGSLKKVEQVEVGDMLMGDDSTVRTVLELCRGRDHMYTINQSRGMSYTVNRGHILSLKDNNKTIDIKVSDYLSRDIGLKGFKSMLDFKDKSTSRDPWTFGFFMATGDFSNIDSHLIKYRYPYRELLKNTYSDCTILERIPLEYKINSQRVRMQFLSGVCDSIGNYSIELKKYVFRHKSIEFIEDLSFLCRSLGYDVVRDGNVLTISGSFEEYSDIDIKYVGVDDYYGFVLDGNHRFLLEDFTVTHNTGKSTLIKSILYSKKHIFPTGKVHSGTEDSNGFFGEIMPSSFIENGLDLNNLLPIENFKTRQQHAKKHLETRGQYPWSYLIIDDCSSDSRIFKKPIFQEVYKNGRHWRMMHLLSLQYCLDIPPPIRVCIDGTFILRETNPNMRKKLFENFGGCVDTLSDWNDLMDQLTDNYSAMFINNKCTTNKIEDAIMFYKAEQNAIPKDWKIGCREYWEFHNDRFEPDESLL